MRIAFLGSGKVGKILIRRFLESGHEVIATARTDSSLGEARRLGAVTSDNGGAVKVSDFVFLAVKPNQLPGVLKAVPREYWRDKVVVFVVAGIRVDTLVEMIGNHRVFRSMINLASEVGIAAVGVSPPVAEVTRVLSSLGSVYWIQEEYLDTWTGLVGSGTAFVAEIVDALSLGAVASGMFRELAYRAVLDVLEGTAQLLRYRNVHPSVLRDDVTTPAGTTIQGIKVMESVGVKSALIQTIETASRRSSELGKILDQSLKEEGGEGSG